MEAEEECLAGHSVTSGPQEVMVTKVEETSVAVVVAALTEATAAAKIATVVNCIVLSERLRLETGSKGDGEKKNTASPWGIFIPSQKCPPLKCLQYFGQVARLSNVSCTLKRNL